MSIKIATKIWSLRGIPSSTKFILVKLADNANDDGVCWPSISSIADECEVSIRTVQYAIAWAERHKIIHKDMRSGRSTVYHMTPSEFAPTPLQNLHPCKPCTPANLAPTPLQTLHPTPAESAPTHIEPSNEPSNRNRQTAKRREFLKPERKGNGNGRKETWQDANTRITEKYARQHLEEMERSGQGAAIDSPISALSDAENIWERPEQSGADGGGICTLPV